VSVKALVLLATWSAALAVSLTGQEASAYRLIQNSLPGRTSTGAQVTCTDPLGFTHWATASIAWRLNPANQGSRAGMIVAFQNAMAAWNAVSPASYTLTYAGTTNSGFATDGTNTVQWGSANGCTGGCLALTALVLVAGQVITEADISMNNAATWNTNGSDYDAQAILTHELGHTLGIHHTEVTQKRNRPSMYASYFGTDARTLESDDVAALNCSFTRYPPAGSKLFAGGGAGSGGTGGDEPGIRLTALTRPGGANLRFMLPAEERVRLDLYDVAGRHLSTLMDESRAAGEHEIAWDGTTGYGHARPGVYFARLQTPEGRARATVVLVE